MPEGEGGEARGRLSCSRVIARRVCRAARRSDWTPTANNKHKHQLSPKISLSLPTDGNDAVGGREPPSLLSVALCPPLSAHSSSSVLSRYHGEA